MFCKDCDIIHKTGIPYNPAEQAIVEWVNMTLKQYFAKIKRGEYMSSSTTQLASILFILKFLKIDSQGLAMEWHWQQKSQLLGLVQWKDLDTGQWEGLTPFMARVRERWVFSL